MAPKLTHAAFLEDELRARVRGSTDLDRLSARNADITIQYFGLDGRGGITLQEVGDGHGVTKERVRQICRDTVSALSKSKHSCPKLMEAIEFVKRQVPTNAEGIEIALQKAGITRRAFRLEGVVHACAILNKPVPFGIYQSTRPGRIVVGSDDSSVTKEILGTARRTVKKLGATTIHEVAASISTTWDWNTRFKMVRGVLEAYGAVQWLDRDSGWFWFGRPRRTNFVKRIKKILSVTGSVDVAELRNGLFRPLLMGGCALPPGAVLEICKSLPFCKVKESKIEPSQELNWRAILKRVERTIVAILHAHGPMMSRLELGLSVKRIMNRKPISFYPCLFYSPVLRRYGRNTFGLRGTQFPPDSSDSRVQHCNIVRPRRAVYFKRRNIWVAFRVTAAIVAGRPVPLPQALPQSIDGTYDLMSPDEALMGPLSIRNKVARGLEPFFHRRGGEPEDTVVVEFDPKLKTATAMFSDDAGL